MKTRLKVKDDLDLSYLRFSYMKSYFLANQKLLRTSLSSLRNLMDRNTIIRMRKRLKYSTQEETM